MALDAPSPRHLVYHFGVNLVRHVVKRGRVVVRDARIVARANGTPGQVSPAVCSRSWKDLEHNISSHEATINRRKRKPCLCIFASGIKNLDQALKIDPEYDDAMAYENLLVGLGVVAGAAGSRSRRNPAMRNTPANASASLMSSGSGISPAARAVRYSA